MEHLSLDALADLLAAEGSADDEAHLSACEGCAGRLDELAAAEVEVAAVLASLPAPPLPDGLAARLQAAFDAEPALTPVDPEPAAAAAGDARTPAGSATVTPFPSARPGRRRSWAPLSAAAAAIVLAAGAVLGLSQLSGGDDVSSTTAVGGGGGGTADDAFGGLTRNETGTDYAADGTLAAALPTLLGGSAGTLTAPLSATGSGDTAGTTAEAAPQPAPQAASEAAQRAGEPDAVLDSSRGDQGGGGDMGATGGRAVAPELDRLRTPDGLASCLAALLPPEEPDLRPLAVDYAAYAGRPALVVLLPATGGAAKVDVFVVGAGCTAGDDQTLFFGRFDAP